MNLGLIVKNNIKKILSDKDERNLVIQVALAFLVKGFSLIVSFFSMPLYIKYFNNDEVLGLWYTILSMIAWLQICDLGLGNGLRNRLTEALAIGDIRQAKEYISSTYAALICLILPIISVLLVVIQFVDLNTFFNIDQAVISAEAMTVSISMLLCGVCLSFVLKTIHGVFYAIQKSSYNNVLSLITSVLPLFYVGFVKSGNMEQNLLALTVVHVLAINLPMLLATLVLFCGKRMRAVAPTIKSCKVKTAQGMLGFGLQFFGAQITFTLLISTNEIVITRYFSAADVVPYSIYLRLFTLVGSLFMLALTPLWSKITKDFALKRYRRIRATNRALYAITLLAVVAEFLMATCAQFVVNIWLGDEAINISTITALVFAFYGSVYICNVVLTTVANGVGDLKTQIVWYSIFVMSKIPVLNVFAGRGASWDIVILYNAVALLIFCIFQVIWLEKTLNRLCLNEESK